MSTLPHQPLHFTLPGLAGQQRARIDGAAILRTSARSLNPDTALSAVAWASAVAVLLMLATLLVVLAVGAWPSIHAFGVRFVSSTTWRPEHSVTRLDADGNEIDVIVPGVFGALPFIYGTAVTSALALLFAVPASLATALFLVRIAPRMLGGAGAGIVSFAVEFVAAIPSIAFGIWGLFVLVPFLGRHVEPPLNGLFYHVPGLRFLHTDGATTGRDLLAAGLILAVMVTPIITAVARDVLRAVPIGQTEAATALGATWWQCSWASLRYGRAGLFGAIMLGLARAVGETMAVTMVIGNSNHIHGSIFEAGQTLPSLLANEFKETSAGMQVAALIELGLVLLVMSLTFNAAARWLVGKRPTLMGAS